tara:strand:- start:4216 stop:4422 length:207 start_codon:yes stop_codon:yes gene_type:complete
MGRGDGDDGDKNIAPKDSAFQSYTLKCSTSTCPANESEKSHCVALREGDTQYYCTATQTTPSGDNGDA